MPALHDWRRAAILSFLALPFSLRAERTYQEMPRLGPIRTNGPLPMLSIIVPARDEEENLRSLLPSLRVHEYPGPCEVIVVDDNSTDQTAAVASAMGARVLRLNHLPDGWKGKPHACHQGALAARGEWLLFTDADTVHAPGGPARSVSHALQHGFDGLSVFVKQACKGSLDRLALTAAYAGLFAGANPQEALLNGQYILLHRDVYAASGGFEAVRNVALEDVAFGRQLRNLGYQVPMLLGEDVAEVQMYDTVSEVWHGMNRLSADSLRWTGLRGLATALFITALMSPLVTLAGVLVGQLNRKWLPATWLAVAVSMFPWAKRFGSPWWSGLAPIGAFFVQLAAVWGILNRVVGRGVRWKGRRV